MDENRALILDHLERVEAHGQGAGEMIAASLRLSRGLDEAARLRRTLEGSDALSEPQLEALAQVAKDASRRAEEAALLLADRGDPPGRLRRIWWIAMAAALLVAGAAGHLGGWGAALYTYHDVSRDAPTADGVLADGESFMLIAATVAALGFGLVLIGAIWRRNRRRTRA